MMPVFKGRRNGATSAERVIEASLVVLKAWIVVYVSLNHNLHNRIQ